MVRKGRGQQVYLVLGQTDAGRYLLVAIKDYGRGAGRIITARDMDYRERRIYQRG